jgi:hypothetical protein
MTDVKSGQLWADSDPRSAGRTVRVHHIEGDKAVCVVRTNADDATTDRVSTTTRIALRRFADNARGYRLIEEA